MQYRSIKHAVIGFMASLAIAAQASALDLDKQVSFKIPAQTLAAALVQFSKQAELQVVTSGEDIKALSSEGATGTLAISDALAKLLKNSGLSFRLIGDSAISIGKFPPVNSGDNKSHSRSSNISSGEPVLRLVQMADANVDQALRDASAKKTTTENVEEMVVEGAREKRPPFSTANLDLTRTEDDALPFVTFTAKDIELSGAASLQEFFQNRLPQNFSPDMPQEALEGGYGFNSNGEHANRVNMRGWGDAETIFLLNGRRMMAEYVGARTDASNATPNLQSIPLGSIERIEILPSAGSAIYGANATGGVINIITRQDYRGGQLSLSYQTPALVHRPSRGVDVSYGLPLSGKTSLRLRGGYTDYEPLRNKDTAAYTVDRYFQRALAIDPSRFFTRILPQYSATPNVAATSTSTVPLFGPEAAFIGTVRSGYTGGAGLSGFIPGVYNLELSEYFANRSSGVEYNNASLGMGLDRTFNEHWRWSFDSYFSRRYSTAKTASGTLRFIVGSNNAIPANAPINPFGQIVTTSLTDQRVTSDTPESELTSNTINFSSTMHGSIGDWRGFMDVSYSRNIYTMDFDFFWEPVGGWVNAFMTGAYNPFVDTRYVAPATPEFYANYVKEVRKEQSETRQYASTIKASGPLFRIAGNEMLLTTGMEWTNLVRPASQRVLRYVNSLTGQPATPVSPANTVSLDESPARQFTFESYSAYAEITLPLVAAEKSIPLINKLEIFGSGRLTRQFTDAARSDGRPVDSTVNPSLYAMGFRYELMPGVSLRATQSIGFKPPGISQITPSDPLPSNQVYTVNLVDRVRNESIVTLRGSQRITGGNPDLLPESTKSRNFGLIFTSVGMPGFRLSLDYLDSVRDDAITSVSDQDVINYENDLPGRIVRGAPDGNASGVGPILRIDSRTLNFRQISTRSLDLALDQQFQNVFGGRLSLALAVTKNLSFKFQSSNTAPAVEMVRNTTSVDYSRQIAWNGNGQLQWQGRNWTFGWGARYFDYLLMSSTSYPPGSFFYMLQGGDRAPVTFTHDAFMNYRLPQASGGGRGFKHFFAGGSVTFGAKNVLDRKPRFWAPANNYGVAPFDSVLGRTLWLQMRKDFE